MEKKTDSRLEDIRDEFVRPFYMSLLHANLRWKDRDSEIGLPAKIGETERAISDAELNTLLEEREHSTVKIHEQLIRLSDHHDVLSYSAASDSKPLSIR